MFTRYVSLTKQNSFKLTTCDMIDQLNYGVATFRVLCVVVLFKLKLNTDLIKKQQWIVNFCFIFCVIYILTRLLNFLHNHSIHWMQPSL